MSECNDVAHGISFVSTTSHSGFGFELSPTWALSRMLRQTGDGWEADEQAFMWTHSAIPWVYLFTEEVAWFPGAWWPKKADGSREEKRIMSVWVCRRVGLALAPYGPDKAVRAFFVRRPVLAILPLPRRRKPETKEEWLNLDLSSPIITSMPDPEGVVRTRWGALKVHDEVRQIELCPATEFPGEDLEFIEVTSANVAAVIESGFPQLYDVHDDTLAMPNMAYTKSPPDSRAARLERALLYGKDADDPSKRLMALLEQTAQKEVDGLRAWVDGQLSRIEDAMTRMASGEPP